MRVTGDDELYRVPLAEFTVARDALARRLKDAGDGAAAAEAKRLRKPSIPAWAANQVVWHAPAEWQRLQAAAAAMRRAHEEGASPEELREASREQREAVSACESRAAEMLERHGHGTGPSAVEKVGHTLLALAYGAADAEPGRLEQELQPPGFDLLAGLTLAAPPASRAPSVTTRAPSAPPARAATPGRAPVAAHEREAAAARENEARRQELARRRAAREAAQARQSDARRALTRARARVSADEERCAKLESELEAAREHVEESRRLLQAAEAEDAAADAALAELEGGERD